MASNHLMNSCKTERSQAACPGILPCRGPCNPVIVLPSPALAVVLFSKSCHRCRRCWNPWWWSHPDLQRHFVVDAPHRVPLSTQWQESRKAFNRISTRKATRPDEISNKTLRAPCEQLALPFSRLLHLSIYEHSKQKAWKTECTTPVKKPPKPEDRKRRNIPDLLRWYQCNGMFLIKHCIGIQCNRMVVFYCTNIQYNGMFINHSIDT